MTPGCVVRFRDPRDRGNEHVAEFGGFLGDDKRAAFVTDLDENGRTIRDTWRLVDVDAAVLEVVSGRRR